MPPLQKPEVRRTASEIGNPILLAPPPLLVACEANERHILVVVLVLAVIARRIIVIHEERIISFKYSDLCTTGSGSDGSSGAENTLFFFANLHCLRRRDGAIGLRW
jgi:hypothetical protein